ncbi:MAG: acyl-CoA synthetase [Caulobacteraceae bacterium]|nr:acyl-CoA synthetase [Caulobacteraceae bacterium]
MAVKSLADIVAIEAVPLAERGLPESTYAALAASAKRGPDRTALTFFLSAERLDKTHVWTYAELFADITRTANVLASLGVTTDRPSAFVLPNLPETHFAIWGGEAAGAALALNPMLEPKQIVDLMRSARASVLVTLAPALNANAWPALAAEFVSLPDLKAIVFVDMADYPDGDLHGAAGVSIEAAAPALSLKVVNLREAMREQPSDRLVAGREIRGSDISSYACTGGTTGSPKIAVRTHRSEVFDAWAASSLTETDDSPRTVLCGLPLFHVNGQLVTGLQPWMRGDHVVLATPEGYRGKNVVARFWDIVARFRVSTFSGVSTLYSAVLETPIGGKDISSLRFAICGAAPMPLALISAFEAKTGLKVVEGYGLTEGACVSSVNPPEGQRHAGSVGLPIPYQRMAAIVLDESGRYERMVEIDEIGVIAINGPNVFSGYLDPRHNIDLWIDIDGERWLNTGDLGRRDANGYFWLAGRKKELIIRGGHNIDPKIIEDALQRHPAVAMVAAIGSPDAYAGELPVAYVQLKPGLTVTEAELVEHAARTIPEKAAVPKRVKISSSLPTTAVGKLFKPALIEREIEETIRAEAKRVGAEIASIRVDRDPRSGLRSVVAAAVGADRLKQALDRYAFKFEATATH